MTDWSLKTMLEQQKTLEAILKCLQDIDNKLGFIIRSKGIE